MALAVWLANIFRPKPTASRNNSEGFAGWICNQSLAHTGPGTNRCSSGRGCGLGRHESSNQTIAVPAGTTGIKATLVWTDPPGEGLQSDLTS